MGQATASTLSNSSGPSPADKLFTLIYRPGPKWLAGKQLAEQPLGPHRAHIERLLRVGRVVLAGPFLDTASGGFVIVRANDESAASAVLRSDPAVIGGLFVGEVRPWLAMFDGTRAIEPPLQARQMAEANIEVVRRIFAAVERRGEPNGFAERWAAYEAHFDPNVAIHEAPSLPYGGDYTGPAAVARHAQGFNKAWSGLQSEDERAMEPEFFAEGNSVTVVWQQRAHNSRTGERFEMPAVGVYQMHDGRVIDARMFHFDSDAARSFLERVNRVGN